MGKNSKIQWTDHTFNPWIGCEKVSAGCKECYAEEWAKRWGRDFAQRKRTNPGYWRQPLQWNEQHGVQIQTALDCGAHPGPQPRVFCGSLCDWLDDKVPLQWLADLLKLISLTPNLDWLLLTKRPENWERINDALKMVDCESRLWTLGGLVPHNVWIGTSVENQEMADKRIPYLFQIPAKIHFLSCEPLLGPIVFDYTVDGSATCDWSPKWRGIDWVIVGGESGPKARPCDIDWIYSIVHQCKAADVPVFVKQLGSIHLNHPKGGDPDEWPEDLRVRQFPR